MRIGNTTVSHALVPWDIGGSAFEWLIGKRLGYWRKQGGGAVWRFLWQTINALDFSEIETERGLIPVFTSL
jgi:hypothetical protein